MSRRKTSSIPASSLIKLSVFPLVFGASLRAGAVTIVCYFGILAPARRQGATLLGKVILTLGALIFQASENLPAAQTLGIPARRVLAVAWGVASALGVVLWHLSGTRRSSWIRSSCWTRS